MQDLVGFRRGSIDRFKIFQLRVERAASLVLDVGLGVESRGRLFAGVNQEWTVEGLERVLQQMGEPSPRGDELADLLRSDCIRGSSLGDGDALRGVVERSAGRPDLEGKSKPRNHPRGSIPGLSGRR